MKIILNLIIITLLAMSCGQNSSPDKNLSSELTDTLKYRTLVLKVEGMTCEGCEMTIQKTVGDMKGIKDVMASHIDSKTTLVYDTSLANVVLISEKINELGYSVKGELAQ